MHTENALKEIEFNRYNSSLTNYYDSPIGHKKLFFTMILHPYVIITKIRPIRVEVL